MTDLLTENARLRAALELAADRLLRCAVEYDAGTLRFIETGEWADEARAALAPLVPDAPLPEHERDGFGRPINPATPQNAVYLGQHSVAPAPDAQSGVHWCAACRNIGAIHCAHPDECGNMRRITRDEIAAQADSWKSWLDDLPLPEFQAAIDGLQDYLTIVVNALFTLNIEDDQPKHPAPDAVQEAARVPEIAALIEAAGALGVRGMVAGWNGEGREHPYTPHPASLWAKINTTCGAVYALDAALRAIAGDRTAKEAGQ